MDGALKDDLVTVPDRNDDLGSYSVRIGIAQRHRVGTSISYL